MIKKYSRAPISEVIIGVCYSKPKISLDAVLSNALLSDKFPILEINLPLTFTGLKGFQLYMAPTQNSGHILAMRRSADRKWLVQIQADMLFINWIRPDTEPVTSGHYIGFSAIKKEFFSILSILGNRLNQNLLADDIAFCYLAYHDRFPWQPLIPELSQINQVMNVSTPPKFSGDGYNNIFSQFTFHDSSIQGFGIININSSTSVSSDNNQLIRIESILQGDPSDGLEKWLKYAHLKQLDIFEKLFKEGMKKTWE